jgi:transcriptional regulator with XRE-family HTH domain
MTKLEKLRLEKGLSQRALAKRSGVAPATVYELENGRRKPNPSTLRKLAEALEVEVKELMEEKMQVRIEWVDENDNRIAEQLRFTGEELEDYLVEEVSYTLFECPGGYRVHEEYSGDGTASLLPYDPSAAEPYHRLFTAEEVAEEYPAFAHAVGVMRVRDID